MGRIRKPRIKIICPICKKEFPITETEKRIRESRTDVLLTCSRKCSSLQRCNYHNNKPYKVSVNPNRGGKHINIPSDAITADEYTLEVKDDGVLVYTPVLNCVGGKKAGVYVDPKVRI